MAIPALLAQRLINQQIAGTALTTPAEAVAWLGAMQAQDFAMAKWAIGLRIPGLHDANVEAAFNDGKILRTHVLRPTWHFVSPADIRWMLALTAPRVNAICAYYNRQTGLDAKTFKRTNAVITKALQGGNHLTRTALQHALAKAKIEAEGTRLAYIIMHAELNSLICSGPRQGKQFTYALLDERVPATKPITHKEALIKLTLLYFTSRGPATIQDFATWSGLAITDVKEAIALAGNKLEKEIINGQEYLFSLAHAPRIKLAVSAQTTFLMPDYDEYGISYRGRSEIFGEKKTGTNAKAENPVFYHTLIADGVAAGTWKKVTVKNKTSAQVTITQKLSKAKQHAIVKAVKKYEAFVNG